MAIIVDREKKRKNIALSCTELLLTKGFKNLRVSEIAKTAGIGKGTIYDYYKNKEDIVFEIIRHFMDEHQHNLNSRFEEDTSSKDKVLQLFDFYLCEFKDYQKHLDVYKEYLSVTLSTKANDMIGFNRECSSFVRGILKNIIDDGINQGELIKESEALVDGIMSTERGFMLKNWTEDINCREKFKKYIDVLFNLIEIKK